MRKFTFWLFFLLLTGCSTAPFTGRKQLTAIPSSQMTALGVESYDQALDERKLSDNQEYKNMIVSVGNRITMAVEAYLNQNDLEQRIKHQNPPG